MSKELDTKVQPIWCENPGAKLIKSVTVEWDQTYYFCATCGHRIGMVTPETGWVCGWTDWEISYSNPCPGKEWTMGKIKMQDTHTGDELNLWKEFSQPKSEARNTVNPAPVQMGNPFLASMPGPDPEVQPATMPRNPFMASIPEKDMPPPMWQPKRPF